MSDQQQDSARKHLEVLELGDSADWADVKESYRFLAKVWPPDRFGAGSGAQHRASERFKIISDLILGRILPADPVDEFQTIETEFFS